MKDWKSLCYISSSVSQGVSDHSLLLQIKINTCICGQIRDPSVAMFLYYLVTCSRLSEDSLPRFVFNYCVPRLNSTPFLLFCNYS